MIQPVTTPICFEILIFVGENFFRREPGFSYPGDFGLPKPGFANRKQIPSLGLRYSFDVRMRLGFYVDNTNSKGS